MIEKTIRVQTCRHYESVLGLHTRSVIIARVYVMHMVLNVP